MLRAAHYKPDAVDLPQKSPPKHRPGGILDLALTAADKYALSLLPAALKGTGLVSSEVQAPSDFRSAQQYPSNGGPSPFKMQRGMANPMQTVPPQMSAVYGEPALDSRITSSWDASFKEILQALEPPDNRTLKPAKLRDHKYPNQNHGMPSNFTIPPPRRELEDALVTLPGGTRRNKPTIPSYSAAVKGFSRQTRRPEVQNVDVQYDLVPGVRLAWAGSNNTNGYNSNGYNASGAYSTTGFGGSPKKYTSQLVGRVSPHYAGMPVQQASTSLLSNNQDPLHLPDITSSVGYRGGSNFASPSSFGSPSYQSWTHATPPVVSSHSSHSPHSRKALPYVSSNAPSLAKPITVQYHPVLKSTSMGATPQSQPQPLGTSHSSLSVAKSTPQRPSTDQGGQPYLPLPVEPSTPAAKPYGSPPYRLPHTPPEVAAEVARLRHAQELDGVINGVRSDLQRAASPRNELPMKSKFLQMYEDPNRPLAKLNPKQLLAEVMPQQQQPWRTRPSQLATDKRPSAGGGGGMSPSTSPNGSGAVGRSPMYERRLKPLPSGSPGDDSSGRRDSLAGPGAPAEDWPEDEAEASTLQNVHLAPPEIPAPEGLQEVAAVHAAVGAVTAAVDAQAGPGSGRSTPLSLLLEQEDTTITQPDLAGVAVEDAAVADADREAAGAQGADAELPANEPAAGDVVSQAVPAREAAEVVAFEAAQAPAGEGQALQMPVPPVEAEQEATPTATPEAEQIGTTAAAQEAAGVASQEPETGEASSSTAPEVVKPQEAEVVAALEGAEPAAVDAPGIADAAPVTAEDASAEAAGAAAPLETGDASAVAASGELPGPTSEGAAEAAGTSPSALAVDVAQPASTATYTLPPGITPEMAEASVLCIQAHLRGYRDRRRVADIRQRRVARADEAQADAVASAAAAAAAEQVAVASTEPPAATPTVWQLPPGVTPEMVEQAVICIQSHARGYFARRRVAELRKGGEAGTAALADAVSEVERRKTMEDGYRLPPGVTPEMAEGAVLCIQAHARGHLARRRVKHLRATRAAGGAAEAEAGEAATVGEPAQLEAQNGVDTSLREAGEAVATGAGAEEPSEAARAVEAAAELVEAAGEETAQELTIDALKAALEDDEDDTAEEAEAAGQRDAAAAEAERESVDPSDPAAIAAAAAAAAMKGAIRLFSESPDSPADTATAVDQATAEASMARLAASSARTSAMFQGAGAEMRYSDDEASALELMDNLDGLLQGDDEAAAAAAAVAAAAAPVDGELVSISADGVSEPQALGSTTASASGAAPGAEPMDVTEPGGVRVLAGKYEVQHVVGEGAYGMVMKCKVRGTDPVTWVAIKEFKIDDSDPDAEDVKRTSLREVAVLEALQHPHVVGFVDKFMVGDRLFIVMEFLPCNLLELLEAQPGGMDRDAVRLIMFQLCSAIAFIHSKGMVYRDIKPENLLVDEHGTVKLCDFGFARYLPSSPNSHLTDYVATRWYRAPELLLGPPYQDSTGKRIQYLYGPQVDMWAVGCLMGELLDGEPLFAGDSDLDQLYRVQQILGPMAATHQYLFYANPHNTGIVFNIKQPITLGARYRGKVSDVELSFMSGLLEMDPDKRLTGEECLRHPYLADLAAAATTLPTPSMSGSLTATEQDMSSGGAAAEEGPRESAGGGDAGVRIPAPDAQEEDAATAVAGLGAGPGQRPPDSGRPAPAPAGRGASWRAGVDPVEKAGSLTRAAGSLTRGGRSVSRNSMSSVSPVPESMSVRPGVLRATENGEVVIVEGVEEGEVAEAVAAAGAPVLAVTLPSVAVSAGLSEIEPAD